MRKSIPILFIVMLLMGVMGVAEVSIANSVQMKANKTKSVAVLWSDTKISGSVEVSNGRVEDMVIAKGFGKVSGETFKFNSKAPCRLTVRFSDIDIAVGPAATTGTIGTENNPFSFFLRDVSKDYPIFIPEYGVIVTEGFDRRSYGEIVEAIRQRNLKTKIQQIESQPEETFETAAAGTVSMHCPTWLGLSRDIRIFEMDFRRFPHHKQQDWIRPGFNEPSAKFDRQGVKQAQITYEFMVGRGGDPANANVTRRLEDGTLPILHAKIVDEDITYHVTAFVTLESSPLTIQTLRGTHYLAADAHSWGYQFTDEQAKEYEAMRETELNQPEETVLFLRIKAVNKTSVPKYAWFKVPSHKRGFVFDRESGFGVSKKTGEVFSVNRLDDQPMPHEELAILIPPGKDATFECLLPHQSISKQRAQKLAQQDFDFRHDQCRSFWREKLASAAKIYVPEKRINEMIQAGLLHLDLITYGLEPDSPLAATIGRYTPIGSESAPIIQFMDSIGWNSVAERALMYFIEKQHEDGFMQNFTHYEIENGAAMWAMGEHYRYTRDDEWVKKITPKLLKSCEYMINWIELNTKEELRGKGYGMISGFVADPKDPFHSYMLNGYAYLGLSRAAEMLAATNPKESERIAEHAKVLKKNIRKAFFDSIAKGPVVPLGNGTWCPTAGPWAEAKGPLTFTEEGNWFTHGSFLPRDFLCGPLYLVFQEILQPDEPAALQMLNYHADLSYVKNVGICQPFYSRHPWIHLKLGQVKPFLRAYYNMIASIIDRETYSMWEHYHGMSPHKTHEEAWFLMQTRWMLYLEEADTLKLLTGIPRAWLENGKQIKLNRVMSYFGPLTLHVKSNLDAGLIEANIEVDSNRPPRRIVLRLPHPKGLKAKKVIGGTYDPKTETLVIDPFKKTANVKAWF